MEKVTIILWETVGNPKLAKWRDLADLVSQSQHRIQFTLPTHRANHTLLIVKLKHGNECKDLAISVRKFLIIVKNNSSQTNLLTICWPFVSHLLLQCW